MKINPKSQDPIILRGQEVEEVDKFVYLGATITPEGGGMGDMRNRINRARNIFTKLGKIWKNNYITKNTKTRLFKTLVLPVLLYGCETWKMNKGDNKQVDIFQNKCLRKILRIKWEDHIKNEEIFERTGIKPVSQEICKRRWKFTGPILRKDQGNDANVALSWAPEGKRKRGRPKTTWRRTVESERKALGYKTWAETRIAASNKDKWRCSVEAICATRHEEDR